jgi:uncharacterized RDD family membrane protein YckC
MVDNSTLTKLRQLIIFVVLLATAAIAVAVLVRIRGGLIVLRAGFAVFNVLSFFYCLSLVGQKAWETSARIANALRHPAKESSNVECN